MLLAFNEQIFQPLVVLNHLRGREGGDGLFIQAALVALDDFLFDLVLLFFGFLQ